MPEPMIEPVKPAENVVAALARVVRDLPGIGRDEHASAQQGGYAYRGIEQITKHVQPLLAREGIVFAPHVLSVEVVDITVNGKPWTDHRMLVSYTVHGPGGVDDVLEVGPIATVGRDNSDKGANKCMTQAFKYALLQVLCISDSGDDADGTTSEADAQLSGPPASPEAMRLLGERLRALGEYPAAYTAAGYPSLSLLKEMVNGAAFPMAADDVLAALELVPAAVDQETQPASVSAPTDTSSGGEKNADPEASAAGAAAGDSDSPTGPSAASESRETATSEPAPDRYAGFKKDDLVDAARLRGLSASGTVGELLDRLTESDVVSDLGVWDCQVSGEPCGKAATTLAGGKQFCPDHEPL